MSRKIPFVSRTSVPDLRGLSDSDFVDVWFSDEETQRWTIGELKKVSIEYLKKGGKPRGALAVLDQFEEYARNELCRIAREQFDALPAWHKKNPAMLANSLEIIREHFPMSFLDLARIILPRMPRLVRGSQNLKSINIEHSSHLFPLSTAVDLPWISFDSKGARNVLLLDVDNPDGMDKWEELPPHLRPFLMVDPWSGRSAALFLLKSPVLIGDGARLGPQFLANAAHEMLATFFKADQLPPGSLTKNPFGLRKNIIGHLARRSPEPTTGALWETFEEANSGLCWHVMEGHPGIELRDIIAHFADDYEQHASQSSVKKFKSKKDRGEPSYIGRNCYVFDLVRFWAYDNIERDEHAIYLKAEEVNQTMSKPLPPSDLRSISKSIYKFMQDYSPARNINKGVMGLAGTDFDQKTKQRLSARRTCDIKADNTDHKIKQALKHWPEGQKLTQAALAKSAGLSLRTIKARWRHIKSDPKKVHFGDYQVLQGGEADLRILEPEKIDS